MICLQILSWFHEWVRDFHSVLEHVVTSLQTRSSVSVGGETSHCSGVHSVSGVQERSDVLVGAVDSYSFSAHTKSTAQIRSDVEVGAVF